VLVDLIIPRDERSGSATDAGVPEFLDFILIDEPRLAEETSRQTAMRGGLAWIDLECQRRFDRTFVACTEAERTALLDDISKPPPPAAALSGGRDDMDEAPQLPVLSHGRAFFASFRDLTATGFWTTKMGMEDLQYQGNRYVASWNGCPDEALKKLGVSTGRSRPNAAATQKMTAAPAAGTSQMPRQSWPPATAYASTTRPDTKAPMK
jgi:hypothetical protein